MYLSYHSGSVFKEIRIMLVISSWWKQFLFFKRKIVQPLLVLKYLYFQCVKHPVVVSNGSYSLFDTKHHAWNRLCHNPWLLSSGTSLAFRCLQWRLFYFRVSCILFVLVVKYFLYIKNAFWCSLLPQHVCKKRSSLIL